MISSCSLSRHTNSCKICMVKLVCKYFGIPEEQQIHFKRFILIAPMRNRIYDLPDLSMHFCTNYISTTYARKNMAKYDIVSLELIQNDKRDPRLEESCEKYHTLSCVHIFFFCL